MLGGDGGESGEAASKIVRVQIEDVQDAGQRRHTPSKASFNSSWSQGYGFRAGRTTFNSSWSDRVRVRSKTI
jgi:hypothetical protein